MKTFATPLLLFVLRTYDFSVQIVTKHRHKFQNAPLKSLPNHALALRRLNSFLCHCLNNALTLQSLSSFLCPFLAPPQRNVRIKPQGTIEIKIDRLKYPSGLLGEAQILPLGILARKSGKSLSSACINARA